MAEKLQYISELAEQTARQITQSPQNWAAFLRTAARLYKYPFEDQLLIYAQRPEASACATIDVWNRRMNRWVNRGSKGIALLSGGSNPRPKYVFDVADTHGGKNAREPQIWQLRPERQDTVAEALGGVYGVSAGTSPERLIEAAARAVKENFDETFSDLNELLDGSLMEELDDLNVRVILLNTLTASVQYALLTRCGIDADWYVTPDDLRGIVNFNTVSVLSCLGAAEAEISETLLRQIERTVKQLERNNGKALENQQRLEYNKFNDLNHETVKEDEVSYGNDIHEERGLSDTGSGDGRTAGGDDREIRSSAGSISERTPERDVHGSDAAGQAESSSARYQSDGEQPDGAHDHGAEKIQRDNGSAESGRSNALDTGNELHPGYGRGDGAEGSDLQLSLFPTEAEQIETITRAEDEKSSAFSVPQAVPPDLSDLPWTRTGDTITVGTGDSFHEVDVTLSDKQWEELQRAIPDSTPKSKPENSVVLKSIVLDLSGHDPNLPPFIAENSLPPAENFHITDDNLGAGGQKTKFGYNLEAIRTLKAIEAENRQATKEEQETLHRYVGWGGIPQAFDKDNPSWEREYAELRESLTDDEYTAARASVLNAHYTSPAVIKAIYTTLERFGFRPGNILEPACGVGNFFGLVPESMQKSKLYGVELDSISGRIAKQLYPNANITVDGFERTESPDDFFDLAIGNVPFGEYKLADRRYDKYKLNIHDYFFYKSLDKVRPGGLVVFITSKGTMDKQNMEVRQYIAQRAELLGAVRLPNNTFLSNAGTEVTSDILILQKRDHPSDVKPEWLTMGDIDSVPANRYFVNHPEMILGTMQYSSRMYGNKFETTCAPFESADLSQQLETALSRVVLPNREALDLELTAQEEESIQSESIPADPSVRNFSYALVSGELYYRVNSVMNPADVPKTSFDRIRGMIGLRESTRRLIDLQLQDSGDDEIREEQVHLNSLYDRFTKHFGLINSTANRRAFEQDSSYSLLCSLEILDEEGNLERKADMFTKRTIRQQSEITSVDTASEALAVSIGEKAHVDMEYMQQLTGFSREKIESDLEGVIFHDPGNLEVEQVAKAFFNADRLPYVTADEYLSGNVRKKLSIAKGLAEILPEDQAAKLKLNIASLEQIQPKDLDASEIDVRIGATWIDPAIYKQFMAELLQTPRSLLVKNIDIRYSPISGVWNISGKNDDNRQNILAYTTYGTSRRNAYFILEDTLNLKEVRIFDTVIRDNAEHQVLNSVETTMAQQKQEAIREAFKGWIWKDPQRRETLCRIYNENFNCIRPREYDGSHICFVGMNPEIKLLPHQLGAVAHVLYGRNALLAHCVGAGKTYEMTAAAMESKRLGLCQKSMFVVPNHLTEQWGSSILQLYPGANVLVATRKDFEPQNRKKFCARIATGGYDAVIIGHSQFEKIPVSKERQIKMIQDQVVEIEEGIAEAKSEKGSNFTIKQMEKTRKSLESRIKRLNDDTRKDDVVTFEELGVDRLFVDEADSFKNLFLYTKMRNVAGIGQTEAQKSSDMFMKCRYMDELTGGRGVVFATGTPISNSMTELYTMMRYLQYDTLQEHGLGYFDSWASAFGETVTATELAPEGTGFRTKTRFAKFYNLPELMSMWKEAADIQTADMLKLPVPEGEYINVVTKPSEFQKDGVMDLAERAKAVHRRLVDPTMDNMLKITNDGRLLALDQRLSNPMLPDNPESKVNACVNNILNVWGESAGDKGAQLVFCDLSTPHDDGRFNVYDDIRNKLVGRGVPADEVAFIHEAKTEIQKEELFAKVRKGQVRVLLGSTAKMGAGTNIQDRLIALHHIDCPWKPRDIEQREGRILRRGNNFKRVKIFRYVTEGTFDSYCWQLIENKQKFIAQIMTSKSPARSCEDIDESVLSYAEVKALATGDPRIKEKMDLDIQVAKLKTLKAGFESEHFRLEDQLIKYFPEEIQQKKALIEGLGADLKFCEEHPAPSPDHFSMLIHGMSYTDKKEAGMALIKDCGKLSSKNDRADIGEYRGFPVQIQYNPFHFSSEQFHLVLKRQAVHTVEMGTDPIGNITRMNNVLEAMSKRQEQECENLDTLNHRVEEAKSELEKVFPREEELTEKSERLNQLSLELSIDDKTTAAEINEDSLPDQLSDRITTAQVTAAVINEKSVPVRSEICMD